MTALFLVHPQGLEPWWFQPLTHTSLNLHCFSNAVQMYGKLLDYANLSIIFFSDFFQEKV